MRIYVQRDDNNLYDNNQKFLSPWIDILFLRCVHVLSVEGLFLTRFFFQFKKYFVRQKQAIYAIRKQKNSDAPRRDARYRRVQSPSQLFPKATRSQTASVTTFKTSACSRVVGPLPWADRLGCARTICVRILFWFSVPVPGVPSRVLSSRVNGHLPSATLDPGPVVGPISFDLTRLVLTRLVSLVFTFELKFESNIYFRADSKF